MSGTKNSNNRGWVRRTSLGEGGTAFAFTAFYYQNDLTAFNGSYFNPWDKRDAL